MSKISKLTMAALPVLSMVLGVTLTNKTYAVATTTFANDVKTIPFTRTVTGVSNPVTNTFTYTVTADPNNPAGGATNAPTSASVVFSGATPTGNTVSRAGALDFTNTTFTKAGDYYFTVTETGSTNPTSFPLDSSTYTAIAAVRYAVNGGVIDPDTLIVTLVQDMQKTGGNKEPAVWQSEASRTYFELSATTTGNVGDVDHCFVYTLNIPTSSGVSAGDSFAVTTASTCSNPSTITASQNTTIRLKNSDTMQVGLSGTLSQLPVGSGYSITLTDAEGYTATFNDAEMQAGTAKTVTGLVAVNDSQFNTKNKGRLKLTKSADVPTGVFSNVAVYVVLFGTGVAGLAYFTRKSRAKNN